MKHPKRGHDPCRRGRCKGKRSNGDERHRVMDYAASADASTAQLDRVLMEKRTKRMMRKEEP